MKVGDLVNFRSDSWIFNSANDRYKNPGIILSAPLVEHARMFSGKRYRVMWADQKVTTEHSSYLRAIEEKCNETS